MAEVRNENQEKKKTVSIFDDFGVRSPVIQKPFSPKNGIPLS